MTDKELMQQALEAWDTGDLRVLGPKMAALRERLAQPEQPYASRAAHIEGSSNGRLRVDPVTGDVSIGKKPEQEPVAWMTDREEMFFDKEDAHRYSDGFIQPLYTTPPRRAWQGLTEEEVDECYYWKGRQWTTDELVRHVEAKLREKNA